MMSRYLEQIRSALNTRGARLTYFPQDKAQRILQNKKLAREIGYGLGVFEEWVTYAQTTYGAILVSNSLDTTGVVVDSKEWMAEIRKGVDKFRVTNTARTTP